MAKLGNWSDALLLYRQRVEEDDEDTVAVLGCMKCLDALGQWQEVVDLCFMSWQTLIADTTDKKVISHGLGMTDAG